MSRRKLEREALRIFREQKTRLRYNLEFSKELRKAREDQLKKAMGVVRV